MKIIEDYDLSNSTTIRIGGIAKLFYLPENLEELKEITMDDDYLLIGGGSNLLINDKKKFEKVISLKEINKKIDFKDGVFVVGSSVKLPQLIKKINDSGFGGIEYLFSVPALVGGAVVMNAGRGRSHNKSISDYIVDVTYLEGGEVKTIKREDCNFSYRDSIFKNSKKIVIEVTFRFEEFNKEELVNLRKSRISYSKKIQDNSKPNFGSVFSESNKYILYLLKNTKLGKLDDVEFSRKTPNWILNKNKSSFDSCYKLINRAVYLHRLLGRKVKKEIIIWD